MTLEDYKNRGFLYADYQQLSQWQRARYFFTEPGAMLWLSLCIWPLSWWELGFDVSQDWHSLAIGPLKINRG